MNHLVSVRHNKVFKEVTYKGENEGGQVKFFEIILILDSASYSLNNSQEIIRNRELKDARFFVSESALDDLIKTLQEIKDKG